MRAAIAAPPLAAPLLLLGCRVGFLHRPVLWAVRSIPLAWQSALPALAAFQAIDHNPRSARRKRHHLLPLEVRHTGVGLPNGLAWPHFSATSPAYLWIICVHSRSASRLLTVHLNSYTWATSFLQIIHRTCDKLLPTWRRQHLTVFWSARNDIDWRPHAHRP